MSMKIKKGDWVIYDREIVHIMETEPHLEYSTGIIRGSNAWRDGMRPLTLQNKVIAQSMEHYYDKLRELDGSASFNFPDISRYFSSLALEAIDGDAADCSAAYKKAQEFVQAAHGYQKVIDGVRLFRPKMEGATMGDTGYIIVGGRTNHNGKKIAAAMMDGDSIVVFPSEAGADKAARESTYFSHYGYTVVPV